MPSQPPRPKPPLITIRLFDTRANPLAGVPVHATFTAAKLVDGLPNQPPDTARTDRHGAATFPLTPLRHFVTLHARGQQFGPFAIEPGDTLSVVL